MKQLTFKDLVKVFESLTKNYTYEEIMDMPIYLMDSEESDGLRKATRCEPITDDEWYDEDEKRKFEDEVILIS